MAHTPSRPSSLVSSTSGSDANTPQICNKFGSGRWRNSNNHSGIRFRICLCGKFDVGKTSLFRRLQGKEFMEEKPYGELSQFDYHDKNDPCIEYSIRDTNGFEERNSLTLGDHYRGAHCILLVYDLTDFTSLEYLEYEIKKIEKYKYSPHCKYILVQNKIDRPENLHITYEKHKDFITNTKFLQHKVIHAVEVSAKTNYGVLEFFHNEIPKLLQIPTEDTDSAESSSQSTDSFFQRYLSNSNGDLTKDEKEKKKKKKRKRKGCPQM